MVQKDQRTNACLPQDFSASPREELQGPLRVKPEYYNIKLAAAAVADFQSMEDFFCSSSVAEMSTKVNKSCFFFHC